MLPGFWKTFEKKMESSQSSKQENSYGEIEGLY
jgi:hypothetical protein